MLRKINHVLNLYLCQSANWQCVIEAEDEESAATTAVEMVMLNSKEDFYCLASTIIVKKLSNNLLDPFENFNSVSFYSPMVLANAGFHIEASNLHINLRESDNYADE